MNQTSPAHTEADLNTALKHTLAMVLAGGRGSRLLNLTDSQAKPAVPFAGKFRIIDFTLSNCINSGIRRVAVPTQYKAHSLIQHVQRGWGFLRAELQEFIEVWPAQQQIGEGTWYQGTADAVFQNLDLIRAQMPEYVLILAGDHIYKQDYSKMLAEHIERGADVTVACNEVPRASASAFGCVDVDTDDKIIGFLEKPGDPPGLPDNPDISFVSMGIYIFSADVMFAQLERDAATAGSSRDFGKDLLPHLVERQAKIYAHRFRNSCVGDPGQPDADPYWRDVGTVDAFWAANLDLCHVTPELNLYDHEWPIWTYHEQRPPAKFVFDDDDRRGYAVDSIVSAGCIVSGSKVKESVLFNNVRINSYCALDQAVILPDTDIGRGSRLKKVLVDCNCVIPENTVIGEDPEADAKRFLRTESGVVLVTARMLENL